MASDSFRVLAHIHDAVIVCDDDYRIRFINESALELYDIEEAEALGNDIASLIEIDAGETSRETIREIVLESGQWRGRALHKSISGKEVYVDWAISKINTDDGFTGFLAITRDIGERIDLEALARSEQEKTLILNSTSELYAYYDLKQKIRWVNEASAKSVGKTPEELIGKTCYETWHQKETPCDNCAVVLARETGKPHETETTTPDGRHWRVRGFPVVDDNGELTGLIELGQDITQYKKTLQAQIESEQRYRAYIKNAPVGIFVANNEGRYTDVNEKACSLTGYTKEELLSMQTTQVVAEEHLEKGRAAFQALKRKGAYESEIIMKRKSGEHFNAALKAVRIGENELMGFVTDITERQAMEAEQKRQNESLKRLNALSIELTSITEEEDLERVILKRLKEMANAMGGVITNYSPVTKSTFVRHVELDSGILQKVVKLLGRSVVGMEAKVSDEMYEHVTKTIVSRIDSLHEVSFGRIPKALGLAMEKALGFSHFYGIAFVLEGKLFGTAVLAMSKNAREPSIEMLEAFANMAAVALRRKQAERTLSANKERMTLALKGANLGTWDWNIVTNEVAFDERWAEMLGYRLDELRPHIDTWIETVHPDDLQGVQKRLQAHLDGEREAYEAEFRAKHKDGQWRWLLDRGKVIERDEEGNPTRAVGTHLDITERKEFEQELLRQNTFIQAIMDNLPIGLAVNYFDEGTAQYINRRFEEIYGWPKEVLTDISEFFKRVYPDAEYRKAIQERITEDVESGDVNRMVWKNIEITKQDGSKGVINAKNIPLFEQNLMISTVQDITEQSRIEREKKKLQEQLTQSQKMESIGRLAGGVAHDFNNLLTSITGNVSLALLDLTDGDPLAESLEEINNAAESAAELTNQLLAFSRKQLAEPKILDLNAVIMRSQKMLRRLIGEDIELRFLPAERLGSVKIDPVQVEQILVNLAVNARDAMPDGGKLTLETRNVMIDADYENNHASASAGEYVMLAISDNGMGIEASVQKQIFEPFFTTKEKGKGTGLGLATVYGTIQQNKGWIEVYSELGEGTAFKIYLPLVKTKAQPFEQTKRDSMPKGTETVVVVEDEMLVRKMAVRVLERTGYKVFAYANGGEAVMALERFDEPIHLLITDVVMPGVNGKVLAEKIKAIQPKVKVLFTSGYTQNVIAHHGILEDGIEFIGKPYRPQALAMKVRAVLDGKKT